jgi:TBC1 domain family member 2
MNCLLMRELPFKLVIRLWDTCLAEREGFDGFYVYVCAALLLKFAAKLKTMRFQELVTFLQRLSGVTKDWSVKDLEELLAQAYVYKTLFTAKHLE